MFKTGRGGCANPRAEFADSLFRKFFDKNCMKIKQIGSKDGCISLEPSGSANGFKGLLHVWNILSVKRSSRIENIKL